MHVRLAFTVHSIHVHEQIFGKPNIWKSGIQKWQLLKWRPVWWLKPVGMHKLLPSNLGAIQSITLMSGSLTCVTAAKLTTPHLHSANMASPGGWRRRRNSNGKKHHKALASQGRGCGQHGWLFGLCRTAPEARPLREASIPISSSDESVLAKPVSDV